MKKYLSYAIALAAVLTVACNKENPSADQPGKGNTGLRSFTAYVDGADSKTVFGESADGKRKSWWSGTESIKVLSQGQDPVSFKTDNLESATESAQFNIDENSTLAAGPWFAVYPDAATPSWTDGTTVTGLALKAEQVAVVDGYEPANHFAIAYTENEILNFKNLVSFIKVTIEVAGVSEVCIFGNNNEKIAGEFTAEWNEGKPTVSEGAVTYAKIQGELNKGSVYYIACLPCTFENGFTLEAVIDGKKFQKKSGNKYTLARNKVLDLGEVSAWPSIHSGVGENWTTTTMKKVADAEGIYKTTLTYDADFGSGVKFFNEYKNNEGKEVSVWARPVSNNINQANIGKWYNIYKGDGSANVPAGTYDVYVDVHNGAVCFVQSGTDMPEYSTQNRALHILCQDTYWTNMYRWNNDFSTGWDTNILNNGYVQLQNIGYNYWEMPQDLNGKTFNIIYRDKDKNYQTADINEITLDGDIATNKDGDNKDDKNRDKHYKYKMNPVKY